MKKYSKSWNLFFSFVLTGSKPCTLLEAKLQLVVPEQEDFYDFEARYEIGRTRFVCPAELDEALTARASEIALEAYSLLGCAGFARVDLMLSVETSELYVLELNPIPGLTETSLLPLAAEAAGISFDELVASVLSAVVVPA